VDRPHVRLYRSNDGHRFQPWVPTLRDAGYPNETDLLFGATGDCHCLLRRDGRPATAMLGHSRPPYNRWSWRTLGVRIGGPVWCRIGGEIYAVVRLYDGRVRTAICRLHLAKARLEERLVLPSGGDSSYAGLLPQDDRLLISYYSAHEQQRCCIYFATVGLSELG